MIGSGLMGGGFLFMLLLFVAAALLVVWLVRALISRGRDSRPTPGATPEKEDAVEVARNRYARGEISKEEFEQIKKDLQ